MTSSLPDHAVGASGAGASGAPLPDASLSGDGGDLPVALILRDRPVAVFGAGPGAAAKLALLIAAGARPQVFADPADANGPCPDLRALPGMASADIAPIDPARLPRLHGMRLVVIAPELSAPLADAIARAAHDAGVLVHAVDRPDLGDITLPAMVRRGPLAIAIHTGGRFPALASVLRQRLDTLLPADLGARVRAAGAARAGIARLVTDPGARRSLWRQAAALILDRPAAPGVDAAALVDDVLTGLRLSATTCCGRVDLVGAGPGGPGMLTGDAARAIQAADVILYDALTDPAILELGRREARRIPVGKRCGAHAMRQPAISALMVRLAGEGLHVVRLKGGDPAIFGRLDEELAALDAAGIPTHVIPGVTAAAAAAAHLRRPLTLRGRARAVTLVAGHDAEGGLPDDLAALAATRGTIAIYMGRDRAGAIAAALIAGGRPAHEPAIAVEWAGRATARHVAATLADLPAALAGLDADGPVTILVGEALAATAMAGATAADDRRVA